MGGYVFNSAVPGVLGAVIGGGGNPDDTGSRKFNTVADHFGTIGGGVGNTAGSNDGAPDNAKHATVAGGQYNEATASLATVGGGWYNRATYERATVGGGWNNLASNHASTVGGGRDNIASGSVSTVPGGASNRAQGNYSFAAGRRAKADHQGTFVWADSTDTDLLSTANDQFLIRATGGVGIGTTSPDARLHVLGGSGKAVYGKASNGLAQTGYGVYGEGNWTAGYGVYGANATDSNYGYLGSSTRGVYGQHSSGNSGSLGGSDYGVRSDGDLIVTGAYNSDLVLTGAFRGSLGPNNGAPFPRPAYDSGWIAAIAPGGYAVKYHNIGLDVSKYVVDIQTQDATEPGYGTHNYGAGTLYLDTHYRGVFYSNLTSSSITLNRASEDVICDRIRVRIWVYN